MSQLLPRPTESESLGVGHRFHMLKNSLIPAGRQWLMPVILVTWEVDIRRIMVQGQPRQIVLEIPSPK
jgi:hypothetical protein